MDVRPRVGIHARFRTALESQWRHHSVTLYPPWVFATRIRVDIAPHFQQSAGGPTISGAFTVHPWRRRS
jgi:hypothetical protein